MLPQQKKQPGKRKDAQRRVLSAARAILRARLARLVLDAGTAHVIAVQNAAPRQNG